MRHMQQSVLATQMKLQHMKKYNYLKYVHVCSSTDSAQFFVFLYLRLKCDQVPNITISYVQRHEDRNSD